jgi:hypothetical protein
VPREEVPAIPEVVAMREDVAAVADAAAAPEVVAEQVDAEYEDEASASNITADTDELMPPPPVFDVPPMEWLLGGPSAGWLVDDPERYFSDEELAAPPPPPPIYYYLRHGYGPCFPYLSAIGALMYLANCTRPDIAFTVNLLARHSAAPTKPHWAGVKNIFRYLQGTKDLGLFYQKNQDMTLTGYSDAGYLSDPHNARSQTGFVFLYGGTAIS